MAQKGVVGGGIYPIGSYRDCNHLWQGMKLLLNNWRREKRKNWSMQCGCTVKHYIIVYCRRSSLTAFLLEIPLYVTKPSLQTLWIYCLFDVEHFISSIIAVVAVLHTLSIKKVVIWCNWVFIFFFESIIRFCVMYPYVSGNGKSKQQNAFSSQLSRCLQVKVAVHSTHSLLLIAPHLPYPLIWHHNQANRSKISFCFILS